MQYTRQSTIDWHLAQIHQHEGWKVDVLRLWIEVGAQTATTQTERGRSEEAMMAAHAAEIAGQRQHRMVTKGDANGKRTTVAIRSKRTSVATSRSRISTTPDVL